MKVINLRQILLQAFFFFFFFTDPIVYAFSHWGPSPIYSAHRAYLAGDGEQLVQNVRTVLADPSADQETKRNALELFKTAERQDCGRGLPLGWEVPPEISRLTIRQGVADEPHSREIRLKITGGMKEIDAIKQLRLIRHPGIIIADKNAGPGRWGTEVEDDKSFWFELYLKKQQKPIPEGLYRIEGTTKNGREFGGPIIITDILTTRTPELVSPQPGQVFKTGHPRMEWKNFYSPQYNPCENRRASLWIIDIKEKDSWDPIWYLKYDHPLATTTIVGDHNTGVGVDSFTSGSYWVTLTYREERYRGPIRLARESRRSANFVVQLGGDVE